MKSDVANNFLLSLRNSLDPEDRTWIDSVRDRIKTTVLDEDLALLDDELEAEMASRIDGDNTPRNTNLKKAFCLTSLITLIERLGEEAVTGNKTASYGLKSLFLEVEAAQEEARARRAAIDN